MPRPFASRLVAWQQRHGRRDLPWQGTRDAYRIWISEIMLQQTQVSTVIPYYQRFLAAFPDVASLAAAPVERVLERWSGLGYYRRAHLAHRAARAIVAEHGGAFPREVETIAALPGIGRSTAAAIAAFAFGTRGAILDGNVKRVLARHEAIGGFPGDARVERELWRRAEVLLPERDIETYTQAMMDLGATVCLRQRPRCDVCPVADDCVARREQRIDQLPAPRPRRTLPRRAVSVLLLERQGEVLLEKRPSTGIWAGLWSLPELAPEADVVAHCQARFAADVAPQAPLPAIEHGFTHFRLTLHPQPCAVRAWPRRAEEPGLLWLPLAEIGAAALPAPIKRLLRERASA
ncbi:MAG TPA: A/G-specific adenine glycosylase [Casimicrobiaceae bacterium]|nr:A/G-specific adenine glycosylase [Casimicrobiaceae bacterium]